MKSAFLDNWKLYLMEALGLAIFMISACFFGGMLESETSLWHMAISNAFLRMVITGVLMGLTAIFIFYSPFTAPSGAHINPAVTLAFLRLKKIDKWNALFYIIFQFAGGTIAVYGMAAIMGETLTRLPVNYAATVPGKFGLLPAIFVEFIIAFIMMGMILFTSSHKVLKKYTRDVAGCMVCIYVILAGPVSGFGMNPARTFASALPSHTWTAFWAYLLVPIVSMLCAAEVFLLYKKSALQKKRRAVIRQSLNRYKQNSYI